MTTDKYSVYDKDGYVTSFGFVLAIIIFLVEYYIFFVI